MVNGVKSKHFGCFWKSMFFAAMCYPEKIISENDKLKRRHYKQYYNSFQHILPCKFCRDFIKNVLNPTLPLKFSGRVELLHSIYLWKDAVNKKLINQGFDVNPSPPFNKVLKKYDSCSATCNKTKGICA